MRERIGLVGCVKRKLHHAAKAKDLYISPLFLGRRAYVERTCDAWFVLSAKHGLVHPDDVLEPYDETLTDATEAAKRAWSQSVLRELHRRLGNLAGLTFEAHAGANYLDHGLSEGLRVAGARVERPAEHLGLGEQLAFYGQGAHASPPATPPAQTEPRPAPPLPPPPPGVESRSQQVEGKYAPLAAYLASQRGPTALITFSEIQRMVGPLPPSAKNHRAWWANDGSHTQARAWIDAG